MADISIVRMPGDCKTDLEEVCKVIKFQNNYENDLIGWMIDDEKIILSFE